MWVFSGKLSQFWLFVVRWRIILNLRRTANTASGKSFMSSLICAMHIKASAWLRSRAVGHDTSWLQKAFVIKEFSTDIFWFFCTLLRKTEIAIVGQNIKLRFVLAWTKTNWALGEYHGLSICQNLRKMTSLFLANTKFNDFRQRPIPVSEHIDRKWLFWNRYQGFLNPLASFSTCRYCYG